MNDRLKYRVWDSSANAYVPRSQFILLSDGTLIQEIGGEEVIWESTEPEFCTGLKDICTYAVSASYEQTKRENAQLKELLKECRKSFNKLKGDTVWYPYEVDECIAKIDEALK